jgi:molecular chaperone DnaK
VSATWRPRTNPWAASTWRTFRRRRGTAQVEVSFDIDANGILNVSARDKATGKEQSIIIRASSGLSDDEVSRMVADAEAHADEDKLFHEMVAARNAADNLIHTTRKSMEDLGDKVEDGEKADLETALESLQEAIKGDDKDAIVAKTEALAEKANALAERVYQSQADAGQAQAAGDAEATAEAAEAHEDVVDAEFEEVKDDKKS